MDRTYKNTFIIGIVIILSFPSISSATNFLLFNDNKTVLNLPAIEITGNYITPKEGIIIEDARELLISKLRKDGIKGKIESEIKISEITTKESWENIGIQLYNLRLEYAWIYAIAIIKNKEVLIILSGMPTESVFLADLDNDSTYEVYTNILLGSGLISEEILGFNVSSNEAYRLSMRGEKDFHLYVENGILMTKIRSNKNKDELNKPAIGKVVLKRQGNETKLEIEAN